ncbi:MAG: DUF5684 domain-containing protein, partial [Planctomycetota bacterium]
DYESQFPTKPSYQADGGGEKKKNKLVVPIVIGAVFIVAMVIGYMAVSSFMNSFTNTLDTIDESQVDANFDEVQQFTEDYITLLADGDIDAAIEKLSPEVKAITAKEQIESLAKLVGKNEIVEWEIVSEHYEEGLRGDQYYLWYKLRYAEGIQVFIASVRQVDTGFRVDGIAAEGILGRTEVIGQRGFIELSEMATKSEMPDLSELEDIGKSFAKGFCGIIVVFLILVLIQIISWWVLFEKAGRPGWAAIIPFYNIFVMAEIGEQTTWVAVGACFGGFIPIVGAIVEIACWIMISVGVAKTFGRGVLFGIGLSFLPFIFYPILAFSRD